MPVLVVDDEVQTSRDHAFNLEDWGYQPICAEGSGLALMKDAEAKARQHRCHVAIVDMNLFDRPGDTSGLQLADALSPTICIIFSAYGTVSVTAQAYEQHPNIISFIEKGDDPMKLQEKLRAAMQKFCPCGMELAGPGYHELLRRAQADKPGMPSDEIKCALGCLYRTDDGDLRVQKLHLTLPGNPYPSHTSHAIATRSAVYEAEAIRMDGYSLQREIIKVAERDRIEREVQNYRKYVRDFLPPERCARIEDRGHQVALWNIGAIRYTNIARDHRRPFAEWYAGASSEDVKRTLRDLFQVTLRPWYEERRSEDVQWVYDYYVKHMFKPDFDERIRTYPNQDDAIDARAYGIPFDLRNPVKWTYEHREQSSRISRWNALTHGDLHIGNIFVDEHNHAYVLDYERSGPGYILRDFVELEADIRLKLTQLRPDQSHLLSAFDVALLKPKMASETPLWNGLRNTRGVDAATRRNLQKAFDAIVALRQLAHELTGELERMDQYYWALLMETLISVLRSYSHIQDQSVVDAAKARAMLSAALIAERLAAWNSDWPPRHWPRP